MAMVSAFGQQPGKSRHIDANGRRRVDLYALAGRKQQGRLLVFVEQVTETMERLAQIIVSAFRRVARPEKLHQFTARVNPPLHRQIDEQRPHLVRWNGGEWLTVACNLKLTQASQPQCHRCLVLLV